MSKTADKIRELSKKAASARIAEQQESLEKQVAKDTEIIEKILGMVKDRLIYKEVERGHSSGKQFIVVTEEMVLEDYSNPPKYGSGTSITFDQGSYYSYPHTIIRVNGHIYSHAADLITRYKHDASTAMKKAEAEYDAARQRKEAIDDLENLEPVIKQLMLNYQKTLGTVES